MATKLYNKAIAPLKAKFDGEADNLTVFLASVCDQARRFNWHRLITMPIDDGTTQNLTEICPSRRVGHFKAPC